MKPTVSAPAMRIQDEPEVIAALIPGRWLLKHSTPSWRLTDPEKGFQRIVREERARDIAVAVLDAGRSFPNAIVLATDAGGVAVVNGHLSLPNASKFLVV